ncbi:MAG: TolC family protein [Flavobacteriales bacterium]|nr:TolC family protein [Bacteroidota bacterium]MCB9241067.1 TolC family protein [Flavobacteriales bacterium]
MKQIGFILLLLCLTASGAAAQKVILSEDAVRDLVRLYHPAIGKAQLIPVQAEAGKLEKRGAFDPVIYGSYADKEYQSSSYYNLLDGGLKIPTWFGLSLKSGFEQNSGTYLNPENKVPGGGLIYAGATWTLGNGLLMDKRRAELKKADVYVRSSEAERDVLINQTMYEALSAYWTWVMHRHMYDVYLEAVQLTERRFSAVKNSYRLGDIPAIDTLESFLQVQNRRLQLSEQALLIRQAEIELNAFLWFADNRPLELSDSILPPNLYSLSNGNRILPDTAMLWSGIDGHPVLRGYNYKRDVLDIERKLGMEQLKPTVDVSYNALTEPVAGSAPVVSTQNYKWGLSVRYPILLRSSRGQLRENESALKINALEQEQVRIKLHQQALKSYNTVQMTRDQVQQSRQLVNNYRALMLGEQQKFNGGESSLFLVNSREQNVINAQLKFIELAVKVKLSETEYYYRLAGLAG